MIEAFLAGILASMTPCILVLFPITLYRFMNEKKIDYKRYALYSLGFMTFFIISGLFLRTLVSGSFRSAILLAIAVALISLGILQLMNKINPMNLYPIKNSFLYGAIFSFGVATSPCSVPFLGALAGFEIDKIFISLVLFGLGILVAPTIMLFVGSGLVKTLRNVSHFIEKMNIFLGMLLIASGIYLGFSISSFNRMDVVASSILMAFITLLIIWLFMANKKASELFKYPRILLLASMVFILGAITFHCYGLASASIGYCQGSCFACTRCLYLFSGAMIFSIIGNWLVEKNDLSRLNKMNKKPKKKKIKK